MSVKERIKQFIKYKNMRVSQFETVTGLSNGYVNSIRKSISPEKLEHISNLFPDLNIQWVHFGTGEMILNSNIKLAKPPILSNVKDLGWLDGDYETHITKNGNEHVIISDNNYLLSVKLVSQKAYAGYLAGYSQPEYLKDLPSLQTSVKNFHNGTYRGFEVKGDSMDCDKKYAIQEGDIAIGRQLHPDMWKYKLHIHDYKEWLIVHDGGIIIKHISAHDVEAGIIHCVSYNEDKNIYPDFDLNLKDVYELYNVIKIEKFR